MNTIQLQPQLVNVAMVPVAIYTRVSTLHQVGGRFDSCESQAAICRDFISKRAHEGWREVACYTDAAYSGGTMNRPGVQALMRQIELGEVKVVLIFKLERARRSQAPEGGETSAANPPNRLAGRIIGIRPWAIGQAPAPHGH